MTVLNQLDTLESSGLVRLAMAQPELEYLFSHALVQDAAYSSLVKADRRILHRAIGAVLERVYADRLDEFAPLLAHHFYEANDHPHALKYFTRAGDLAARQYANAEAVMHYTRALEIADDENASGEQLIYLYSARGRALELIGRYAEALANYEQMEALAHGRGDRALELAAVMAQATIRAIPNPQYNPTHGKTLLDRALRLADAWGDRAAQAKILWTLMILHVYSGDDMQQAMVYGEQSLAIARELNLRELLAFVLHDLFFVYLSTGQQTRTDEVLVEARELWRELGNLPMLAETLVFMCNTHLVRGEYDKAIALSEEAYQIGVASQHVYSMAYSRILSCRVFMDRGQMDMAIALMEEAIEWAEQSGLLGVLVFTRADLGSAYGMLGAIDHGLRLARLARDTASDQIPLFQALPLAVMIHLHLLKGELSAAEAIIRLIQENYGDDVQIQQKLSAYPPAWAAVSLARAEFTLATHDFARSIAIIDHFKAQIDQLHLHHFAPEALYIKGKALRGQGCLVEAFQILHQARTAAELLGSRRMLWPILSALSEIEWQCGKRVEAQKLQQQAKEAVAYIADHLHASGLRESFLNLPQVRAVGVIGG